MLVLIVRNVKKTMRLLRRNIVNGLFVIIFLYISELFMRTYILRNVYSYKQ